jgi:hypothetical protein
MDQGTGGKAKGRSDRFRNFDGLVQQRMDLTLRFAPVNSILWWLGVWFNIIWLLGFGWVWIIKTSGCVILMFRDDAVDEHRTNDNRKCSPKWKTRPMADSPSYQRRN